MANETNKKLLILYILKILKEYSDENHPLRQVDIMQKLESIYDFRCDRKTISANLDYLSDFGYDIIKIPKKGVFLGERDFEPSEISFLVDAVFSSKSITSKSAKNLSKKLYNSLSIYERKQYKYIYKADEISRTQNNSLFYVIDTVSRAIDEKKKIEFVYNSYNENKNYVPRQNGKRHIVSPYFMVNSRGKYYLICGFEHVNKLAIYKIEMITNIQITEEKIKPITDLEGYEKGIDIADFINKNIYMLSGESVSATIKLNEKWAVNDMVDWFGKNVTISKQNDCLLAYVNCNKKALIYWCMQYGDEVELLEPKSVREEIKELLHQMTLKYEK